MSRIISNYFKINPNGFRCYSDRCRNNRGIALHKKTISIVILEKKLLNSLRLSAGKAAVYTINGPNSPGLRRRKSPGHLRNSRASGRCACSGSVNAHFLPWAQDTGWILSDAYFRDGLAFPLSRRQRLHRQLELLVSDAHKMTVGFEFAFYVNTMADAKLAPQDGGYPPEQPRPPILCTAIMVANSFPGGWHMHKPVEGVEGGNAFAVSEGDGPPSDDGMHYLGRPLERVFGTLLLTAPTTKRRRTNGFVPFKVGGGPGCHAPRVIEGRVWSVTASGVAIEDVPGGFESRRDILEASISRIFSGRSRIINPNGVTVCPADDNEEVISWTIDLDDIRQARQSFDSGHDSRSGFFNLDIQRCRLREEALGTSRTGQ